MKEKIIYYDNESNNEFSGITRNTVKIDKDFKYIRRSLLWKVASFIAYRMIMTPFAYLWCRLKFGLKIKNKKLLKECKDTGYFIYANHTLMAGDAFIPNLCVCPKDAYMIVHPDNVSQRFGKSFVMMCGAIPTPTSIDGYRSFLSTIETRINEGAAICIYPEAHIWPYYTKIRNFSDTSFAYPVKLNKPVFTHTVTYSRRKLTKIPRVTVYIDGPFFPDRNLPSRRAQRSLRDTVYDTMCKRSELSTYERIKYIKKNDNRKEEI